MDFIENNRWVCKCKCLTKQQHKSKWAFISRYKKPKLNYLYEFDEKNSSTVNKFFLNNNLNIVLPIKKVKFDILSGKIIIDQDKQIDELTNTDNFINEHAKESENKLNENSCEKIYEKDLIELKDLFNF